MPGLATLLPREEVSGLCKFVSGPGAGGTKVAVVVLSPKLPLGRVGGQGAELTVPAEGTRREAGRGERPPCGSVCVHMCWLGLALSLL